MVNLKKRKKGDMGTQESKVTALNADSLCFSKTADELIERVEKHLLDRERLLSPAEAARLLGISKAEFYRRRAKLLARYGRLEVIVAKTKKYRLSVLRQAIEATAGTGKPLM